MWRISSLTCRRKRRIGRRTRVCFQSGVWPRKGRRPRAGKDVLSIVNATDHTQLHIVTYNIHKGFSQFHQHLMVHELREQLRDLGADIVYLQEVQGRHSRNAKKYEDWPYKPQYEFLAEDVWQSTAYG